MDEKIYQIAEQIVQLHQKAYGVYLPLVEDVCSRIVSEDELSYLLDYVLDFACDEKILGLYKRVCRRYLYIYPRACLKIHSRHLHVPLRGIFGPNSGYIAHYAPFIWPKSPTNCDAHLLESNFQTRSRACLKNKKYTKHLFTASFSW